MSSKYATTHYHSYLELNKILNAQHPKSAETGNAAHDEMLFIIIHQAYELWFKQIIHEIESIIEIMNSNYIDERKLHKVELRLNRIIEIQELLIQQIRVLETLSPQEFLEFRDYLFPASGFQSFQFRILETLMGLRPEERLAYNSQPFYLSLELEQQEYLHQIMKMPSLFNVLENWLDRMPFTNMKDFDFMAYYKIAVEKMFAKETDQILQSQFINDDEKKLRITILEKTADYFKVINNKENFDNSQAESGGRLSYKATLSALFIHLYSEEPMLSTPYKILSKIVDIDELFTTWRYRHAQMVMRMIGRKMGTGGSSGHDYLKDTASKHQVFKDFHNISTLLVPSSYIPNLPNEITTQMSFHFSNIK